MCADMCVRPASHSYGKAALGTVVGRMKDLLTKEEDRDWKVIKSFEGQKDPASQKAARAKEKLLDELANGLSRK